jgi:hypothetical protein
VTWSPKSQTPPENEEFPVNDCDITKRPCDKSEEQLKQLQAEVKTATERLDGNFNEALEQFQDIGRFPWTMGEKYIPAKGATFQNMPGSPYIGYYDLIWSQPPSNAEREVINSGENQFGNQFQAASYSLPKACTKKDFAGARLGYGDSVAKLRECGLTLEIHTTGYFEQWRHFFADKTPDGIMVGNDMVGSLVNTALTGALTANQYGRTMFFMAGLPEQKIAASFYPFDMDELDYVSGLSIYDQVYGAGPYTQYLPMVNPDGDVPGMVQPYNDNMWHSFFMSNHMNQSPEHFIRGIRGRTLWHNEWRSNLMFLGYYNKVAGQEGKTFTQNADDAAKNAEPAVLRDGVTFDEQLAHRDFPAGFQPGDHKVPYHGNTCDSCHIRNGSGIPVAPNGQLSNIHTERGLKPRFILRGDYTYSNGYNPRLNDPTGKGNDPIFPSMKMVLFDLKERPRPQEVDANDHTTPASDAFAASGYYSHKIMNFYGNSFHVNLKDKLPTYDLKYVDIGSDEDMGTGGPFEIVDKTPRERCMPDKTSHERCMPESRLKTYIPKRVVVKHFDTGDRCKDRDINPFAPLNKGWPTNCDQVSGPAVDEAIGKGEVGFMHLLGKRLGNTPLIEMIPDQAIKDASEAQKTAFGRGLEGQYPLAAGTRSGLSLSDMNYRSCRSGKLGTSSMDCYIGRWGWIGDRASSEDQVANAAHVEQNITTKKSFALLEKSNQPRSRSELVRYMSPLCGPADLGCQTGTNSDITEQEVRDMATYQRWIGIPQRSEFQVETKAVQDGERLFRSDELGCNKCHIIDKIPFVENDNMLPDEEREKLKKLLIQEDGKTDYPFVSYLGTDLLLHDMGYLSQVAAGPLKKGTLKKGTLRTDSNARRRVNNNDDNGLSVKMRDQNGKIRPGFDAYFQLIRTPPLKGMRFNRFVTDSHHNKTTSTGLNGYEARAGCDFLLHDGRACDAIEAAYLHDGPAVKKIGMIKGLNGLSAEQMASLRAFLYSL